MLTGFLTGAYSKSGGSLVFSLLHEQRMQDFVPRNIVFVKILC